MTVRVKQAATQRGGTEQALVGPAAADSPGDSQAQARLQLLDLAEDASRYLRRHADPTVRVAAALLLASSLAACSSSSGTTASTAASAVTALDQEVKTGLPTSPGTYPISPNSVTRDAQGVYGFMWRNATGAEVWTPARASLMMLAQGQNDALVVPASGDPTLRLKPDTAITLPDDGPGAGPTPTPRAGTSSSSTTSSSRNSSILWYPFIGGGGGGGGSTTSSAGASASSGGVSDTTPAYRNPPAATPGQGSVRGSASSSVSPPSTVARTWTSPSRAARTGQTGGPGTGTAASTRTGSMTGPASGQSRPGSSIFSGGKSGASASSSSSSG